jgi:hypothetical protein
MEQISGASQSNGNGIIVIAIATPICHVKIIILFPDPNRRYAEPVERIGTVRGLEHDCLLLFRKHEAIRAATTMDGKESLWCQSLDKQVISIVVIDDLR